MRIPWARSGSDNGASSMFEVARRVATIWTCIDRSFYAMLGICCTYLLILLLERYPLQSYFTFTHRSEYSFVCSTWQRPTFRSLLQQSILHNSLWPSSDSKPLKRQSDLHRLQEHVSQQRLSLDIVIVALFAGKNSLGHATPSALDLESSAWTAGSGLTTPVSAGSVVRWSIDRTMP